MAEIAQVDLRVNPVLDVQVFNALLKHVKGSLGELGGSLTLIDPDEIERELREVENALEKIEQSNNEAFDPKGVKSFRDALDDTKKGLKELLGLGKDADGVKGLFNLEAAERFQSALGSAEAKISDNRKAMKLLAAQTGLEGAELAKLEAIAGRVFQRGGFETFADSIRAVGVARQFLGDALDDKGLEVFTSGAQAIAGVLDTEVNEVLKKSGTFIRSFELDGEQAFNLIAIAAQKANTPQEDLLDTLAEYSPHFKEAEFSAEEMVGVLIRGGEEAAFNLDKIADAAKETKIRIDDGSIETDFGKLAKSVPRELRNVIGDALQQATDGEISIADFISTTIPAVAQSDLNDSLKRSVFAAVAGTQAEELGGELYSRIYGAEIDTSAIEAQAAVAGEQIANSIAPTSALEELGLLIESSYGQLSGFIGPAIGPASQMLAITNQLGPAMNTLKMAELAKSASQFGLSILQKVVPGMVAQVAVTGTQAGANTAATTTQYALNTAMSLNPALAIATGIGVLVGALVLFAGSGESVEEAIEGVDDSIGNLQATLDNNSVIEKQAASLNALADEHEKLKDKTDTESQKRFAEVGKEIATIYPDATEEVKKFDEAGKEVGKTYAVNIDVLRAHTASILDSNQIQRDGAIAQLAKETRDLVEATDDAGSEMRSLQSEKERLQGNIAVLKDRTDAWAESYRDRLLSQLQNVQIELAEQEKLHTEGIAKQKESVTVALEQGKSIGEISDEMGVAHNRVLQFHAEWTTAKLKALQAADAIDEGRQRTEELANAAADAAAEFDAIKSAASAAVKAQTAGLAGQIRQLRERGLSEREIKQQLESQVESTKEAVAELKEVNKAEDLAKKFTLQTTKTVRRQTRSRRSSRKEQETAFQVAQKQFKLETEKLKLVAREEEISRESTRLIEGRERTQLDELVTARAHLDTLHQQADALKTALGIAKESELDEANITVALKSEKGEVFEAEKMVRELNLDISQAENDIQQIVVGAQVEIDDGAIRGLQERQLELKVGLGLEESATFTEFLVADVERLEEELASFTEREQSRIQGLFDEKIIGETEYNTLLEQLNNGTHQRQLELQNAVLERQTTIRDRNLQLELDALDRRHAKETALLDSIAEENVRVREAIATSVEAIEGKRIDRDANEAISRLEFRKEQELLTIEDFEARKAEIEEESAAKRAAIQARFLGDQLESERRASVESLQLQQKQTKERIDSLTAAGKFDDALKLTETLEDINKQIDEKGGFLTTSLNTLQGEFGDAVVTLFDFDDEKAKEPWRNMFGIIGGALERLLKAKVTSLVLSAVGGIGGIPGAILTFAAKPVIEGILSRLLSPVLDGLLSFASGGLIEGPTLFGNGIVVGDGAKLGSVNKEWIFTHDQLHDVIGMVVMGTMSPMMDKMDELIGVVSDLQFKLYVSGTDLTTAQKRTQAKQQRRIINNYALSAYNYALAA